jgi:hypothetical protein
MEVGGSTETPTVDDVAQWADTYNLDHPILADPDRVSYRFSNGGFPTYVLIDQNMIIVSEDLYPVDASSIESLLSQ